MDFEQLKQNISILKSKAKKRVEHIETEEVTKMSLISPFIRALGYDTEDPLEVVAEYTADVTGKKGEKIDFAIKKDEDIAIIIEAKQVKTDLKKEHFGQLKRYFSVLDCKVAILTNGVKYYFYSDLESKNKLDDTPFFIFDLFSHEEKHLEELMKFTSSSFDEDEITKNADKLKYTRAITEYLKSNILQMDDNFFKFFFSQVYSGNVGSWSNVKEKYGSVVQDAFNQFLSDEINKKLRDALGQSNIDISEKDNKKDESPMSEDITLDKNIVFRDDEKGIVTTVEEIEGFHIIKSILRGVVSLDRVFMRDTKSYCGILLDDINRKPIARLYFNTSQKYLATFDENKKETKRPIEKLEDIYNFSDEIKQAVGFY